MRESYKGANLGSAHQITKLTMLKIKKNNKLCYLLIMDCYYFKVMAINRGEKLKVLTVKVVIPSNLQQSMKNFIWQNFFNRKHLDPETFKFVQGCINDSYERLIEPHISRQIRYCFMKYLILKFIINSTTLSAYD